MRRLCLSVSKNALLLTVLAYFVALAGGGVITARNWSNCQTDGVSLSLSLSGDRLWGLLPKKCERPWDTAIASWWVRDAKPPRRLSDWKTNETKATTPVRKSSAPLLGHSVMPQNIDLQLRLLPCHRHSLPHSHVLLGKVARAGWRSVFRLTFAVSYRRC